MTSSPPQPDLNYCSLNNLSKLYKKNDFIENLKTRLVNYKGHTSTTQHTSFNNWKSTWVVGGSRPEMSDKQKQMPAVVKSPNPFTGPTYSIYFVSPSK